MARPRKWRMVCALPGCTSFGPKHACHNNAINMSVDEYETIRLIDLEGLTQEQCAELMEIARTTVQSIYMSARKKLAECIVNSTALNIGGGEYQICERRGKSAHNCCRKQSNLRCPRAVTNEGS